MSAVTARRWPRAMVRDDLSARCYEYLRSVGLRLLDGEAAAVAPGVTADGRAVPLWTRRAQPVGGPWLRVAVAVAALVSVVTAVGHRPFLQWVQTRVMEDGLFFHLWMLDALTVWQAQRWAPWLAGIALVTLLVLSLATDDLASAGQLGVVVAVTASGLGTVSALPLLLAASRGLSLIAFSIVVAMSVTAFYLLLLYLAFQVALAHLSCVPIQPDLSAPTSSPRHPSR